jgi:hypothetical protein
MTPTTEGLQTWVPIIPPLSRRILLFGCAATVGGLAGAVFSSPVTFRGGTLVILPLSLVAGISTLWSP